jgi:predicted ester cyclase
MVRLGWTHSPRRGWSIVALAIAATLGAPSIEAQHMVSSRDRWDAHTIARRYFEEVWNQGRLEVLDELLSPTYINHTPSVKNPAPGPDGLKPIVAAIRRAFPDLHFAIEDVIVGPDSIVIRTTMTGTHDGDLFGIPPTHRKVRVTQIQIERVRHGRIVEHWRVTDELTLMRQLRVVS